jgi:hypothetical protein
MGEELAIFEYCKLNWAKSANSIDKLAIFEFFSFVLFV